MEGGQGGRDQGANSQGVLGSIAASRTAAGWCRDRTGKQLYSCSTLQPCMCLHTCAVVGSVSLAVPWIQTVLPLVPQLPVSNVKSHPCVGLRWLMYQHWLCTRPETDLRPNFALPLHLRVLQGLEVEVQRLINRHRADLEAAHERAADQVQQALDAAKVDHDAQLQALKERLKRVSWLLAVCVGYSICTCACQHTCVLGSCHHDIRKLPTKSPGQLILLRAKVQNYKGCSQGKLCHTLSPWQHSPTPQLGCAKPMHDLCRHWQSALCAGTGSQLYVPIGHAYNCRVCVCARCASAAATRPGLGA